MKTIYLALGTNLGNRYENLHIAINSLAPKVRVLRESSIYETPPWGYENQAHFLNMVIEAETSLEPRALLTYLQEKEKSLVNPLSKYLIQYIVFNAEFLTSYYDNLPLGLVENGFSEIKGIKGYNLTRKLHSLSAEFITYQNLVNPKLCNRKS